MKEQFQGNKSNIDSLRDKTKANIKHALENSLDISKEPDFLEDYENRLLNYFRTEKEDPELEKMAKRLEESTAFADSLIGFKILMQELNLPKDVVFDYLEHENSHMNATEQEPAHVDIRYGVVLLKEEGKLAVLQPMVATEKSKEATMLAYLESLLRVTNAPELYGHRLSDGDSQAIENYKALIKEKSLNK